MMTLREKYPELTLGMPSLIETKSIEECAALCSALGLQFIELNLNFPQYQPQFFQPERLKRLAAESDLFYTVHFDDNLNIADFNPYVAEGYRRTVREVIALAKVLEIPILNMHLSRGSHYTMPEKKIYFFQAYRDHYLQRILEFREECRREIGDSGIKICVENCGGFLDFQKEAIALLLDSPVFGLTLDVGHNYCAGFTDEPLILQHAGRLRHMHIHDAKNGKQDHLALGTGELDLCRYFELAEEHNCTVVLETKTIAGLRQSVAWLKG